MYKYMGLFAIFALFVSGCASAPSVYERSLPALKATDRGAFEERSSRIQALKGTLWVEFSLDGKAYPAVKTYVLWAKSGDFGLLLGLEGRGPFGATVFSGRLRGKRFEVVIPGEKLVYTGTVSMEVVLSARLVFDPWGLSGLSSSKIRHTRGGEVYLTARANDTEIKALFGKDLSPRWISNGALRITYNLPGSIEVRGMFGKRRFFARLLLGSIHEVSREVVRRWLDSFKVPDDFRN